MLFGTEEMEGRNRTKGFEYVLAFRLIVFFRLLLCYLIRLFCFGKLTGGESEIFSALRIFLVLSLAD